MIKDELNGGLFYKFFNANGCYTKKLCIIFLNLDPRHVADGLVASDTRIS